LWRLLGHFYQIKSHYFFSSDSTLRASIILSFLSITLSSIKLFYSQRIDRYPDYDPSLKMIAFVALPVMILITGPLAAVVCMAAYFKEKVIVHILILILVNAFVLKFPCFRYFIFSGNSFIWKSYEIKPTSHDSFKRAQQESETIFLTALLTSWFSPCTVWINTFFNKSHFLLVSSLTSLLGHFVGICAIFVWISSAELPLNDKPPIIHCFKSKTNNSARLFLPCENGLFVFVSPKGLNSK
jgi:hypothetical protein